MPTATDILNQTYQTANMGMATVPLSDDRRVKIAVIVEHAQTHKGVLAALVTSLVKKIETPTQDIRLHKTIFPNGYSGRSYDFNFVTPFIRQKFGRLAMAESGWLTRSIEQPHPFNLDFPGKIQNEAVKRAFLDILDDIEAYNADPQDYLIVLFQGLIQLVERYQQAHISVNLAQGITVARIIQLLESHFNYRYTEGSGASVLPVIALHSAYQVMSDLPRYQGKTLLPLKSHTTSDVKSTSIGDIEILSNGQYFEAVEVKFNKPISTDMLQIAIDKFIGHPIERFYLLTTASPNMTEASQIDTMIEDIRQRHGCEVIVNGVMPTLKYYLRLLPRPDVFILTYTQTIEAIFQTSTDLKYQHIQVWKDLLE